MSSSHQFQLLGITWLTHWCNLTILQFIIGRILIFLKVDIKRQKLSKVFNKMKKLTNAKNNFIYFIHLPHGINIIEIKITKIIIFYNSSDDVVMLSCLFCEIRKACQGKIWDNEYNIILKVLNGIDGSILFQLILPQENTYTVDLLMMLLTSLEHLLLMNLLEIIFKRLINSLFKTVHICSLFVSYWVFVFHYGSAVCKN